LASPPTMVELLDIPVFREYMEAHPTSRNPGLMRPGAWWVWARMTDGTWKRGTFDDYGRAWDVAQRYLARDTVADVAVVSKRVLFAPPGEWRKFRQRRPDGSSTIVERWVPTYTVPIGLEWCARCRRPSTFRHWSATHHALRLQPTLATDEPLRCYYCGIRRAGLPRDPNTLED
jgi:hypothetical protein